MKIKRFVGPTCMILSAVMSIAVAQPLKATSISEEKDKQQELQEDIESAEQIISELQSLKADTTAYINSMDEKMEELTNYIVDLNQQISDKEAEIETTKTDLAAQQADVDSQYAAMKLRIKYMYENGQTEYLDMLLNSGSISDMLDKAEYLSKITEYDRDMLNKMRTALDVLQSTEAKLEEEQQNLETLKSDAENEQAEVEKLIEDKKSVLLETDAQIASTEESISSMETEMAESQSTVAELQAAEKRAQEAEAARQAAAAAAAAAAASSGSSSGSTTSDGSINAEYNGGSLAWPLPGYYTISSGYVSRINPVTGEAENHKGIDFPAPAGTPIVAAADGTVAWAYRSSSAGNWVGIAHGNGITTVYMHMSAYCVSEGDVVQAGQTIGYVGSTGQSTGNHLHFAVKVNGEYVNPSSFLGI